MSDFPFDTADTAYAVVSTEYRAHSGDAYGTFNVQIRGVRELSGPAFTSDNIRLAFSAQCSGGNRASDAEPFYAWRTGIEPGIGATVSLEQCERGAKALRRINRALEKLAASAGPARLLEDYVLRLIGAAGVQHVYCEERPGAGGRIPDWPYFTPAEFERMHTQVRWLKTQLVRKCNPQAAAA